MAQTARNLWHYRGLVRTLTERELKARYRGSLLGFLWSLVNPLLLLAVYSFVFGFVFERPGSADIEPYSLFLISGLFPWIWLSSSLLEGAMSLVVGAGLIRKAAFPAEILPQVAVLSHLAHFLLALPVLALALATGRLLGYPVAGWGALFLPAVLLLQLVLTSGLTLGLAALNVHFKDVRDLLANLLTLLFFLTPIIYSLDWIRPDGLRLAIRLNPFTPFTLAFQEILFRGAVPAPGLWLQMLAVAALAWLAGTWLFERLRETLVEAV